MENRFLFKVKISMSSLCALCGCEPSAKETEAEGATRREEEKRVALDGGDVQHSSSISCKYRRRVVKIHKIC